MRSLITAKKMALMDLGGPVMLAHLHLVSWDPEEFQQLEHAVHVEVDFKVSIFQPKIMF